jgi:hypothetical protein
MLLEALDPMAAALPVQTESEVRAA